MTERNTFDPPEDDLTKYVGLSYEEARKLALESGWRRTRIRSLDGVPQMGTADYWPNRLNFSVDDGKVTSPPTTG